MSEAVFPIDCRNLDEVLAKLKEELWMQTVVTFLEVLYRFGSERAISSNMELRQESGVSQCQIA